MIYSEYRYYSPVSDANMVRISGCDERGGEFWVTLPDVGGKRWREKRTEALDMIEAAMRQGFPPGRVIVTGVRA